MTYLSALLRPDTGETAAPTVPPPPTAEPSRLDQVIGWADTIPGIWWAAAIGVLFIAMLVTLPWARRKAFRAGQRVAGKTGNGKSTALLAAALAPAAFLWIAVLIGSARGLMAFGRGDLRWRDGWEVLVPLTLDGVGISFGLLAFLAVKNGRNPDRSARLAAIAMIAGAGINFLHEATLPDGSWLGGAYLALMSTFGLMIFHELLAQFENGAGVVVRVNPKFGLRWITWPTNTLCAWIAWRNYPATPLPPNPTDEQKAWWGSVNHAVKHLGAVRRAKRIARYATDVEDGRRSAPWWAPVVPWLRLRQLDAVIAEQITAAETERAERNEIATRLEQVVAEHRIAVAEAERLAEQALQIRAERDAAERRAVEAEQAAERARSSAAEQVEKLRSEAAERERTLLAEHAEQLAKLRTAGGGAAGRPGRSVVTPLRRSTTGVRGSNPMASDTEALAAMFAQHPERNYEWRDREVHRITGAGFSSRAPRLTALATEHQRTCKAEQHSACFRSNDDKEDRADRLAASV